MDSRSAKNGTRPRGRRALLIAAAGMTVLACLALASLAGARPRTQIWDDAVPPTWAIQIHGVGASDDAANAVVSTGAGVFYVAGHTGNSAGNNDVALTRVKGGLKSWTRLYDSPFHSSDVATEIALGPKGVVYTAGSSVNAAGRTDILLVKWSANGTKQWARRYDGPKHGNDNATALGVDAKGNVTVAGWSEGTYSTDYVVVSWSATGARRWTWRYSGSGHGPDQPTDLLVAKDSSVYVTGWARVSGGNQAAVTARFSRAGKKLWTRVYTGPESLGAGGYALTARPQGGVYVGGYAGRAATGIDGLVLRYTPSGVASVFALDSRGSTGTTAQWFNDVAVTSGGHVIAAGTTRETDAGGDAYFEDYTSAGAISWGLKVASGGNAQYCTQVATDALGGYYVLGAADTSSSTSDMFLYRGSQNLGGGFWQCFWGNDASHVGDNSPGGVAVWKTTACVVGTCATPAAGSDQIVLGFVY